MTTAVLSAVFAPAVITAQSHAGNTGDVIDYRTGELRLSETDVTISGRHGLDVILSRTYSSDILSNETLDSLHFRHDYSGAPTKDSTLYRYLGQGWRIEFPYLEHITPTDGIKGTFLVNSDGSKERVLVSLDTVTINSVTYDHRLKNMARVAASRMLLTDGTRWEFDHTVGDKKFLTRAVNRFNDTLLVEYHTGTQWIKSVTSPIGRKVWFYYCNGADSLYSHGDVPDENCARLRELRFLNHLGDTLSIGYRYNVNKNLQYVLHPAGDSTKYDYTDVILHTGSYKNFTHNAAPSTYYEDTLDFVELLSGYTPPGADSTWRTVFEYLQFNYPIAMVPACSGATGNDTYDNQDDSFDYNAYVGVHKRRFQGDSLLIERMVSGRTLCACQASPYQVAMLTEVTHVAGPIDQYYHFYEVHTGEWNPECNYGAGSGTAFVPGDLFHENHLYAQDTTAFGFGYETYPMASRPKIGVYYDTTLVAGVPDTAFIDTIEIYLPLRYVKHGGVHFYDPEFYPQTIVEFTEETSQKRWTTQLENRLFDTTSMLAISRMFGERVQHDFVDSGIVSLGDAAYWETSFDGQFEWYPDSLHSDTLAFTVDSLLAWEYVEALNLTLPIKTKSTRHDDSSSFSYYTEFTYDSIAGYQLSTAIVYLDTLFHIDTTVYVTSYQYDSHSNKIWEVGPGEDTTYFEWDTTYHAFLVKTIDSSLGTLSETEYYEGGKLKLRRDGNGAETRFLYDAYGRDSVAMLPLEDTTSFSLQTTRYNNREVVFSTRIDSNLVRTVEARMDGLFRVTQRELIIDSITSIVDSIVFGPTGAPIKSCKARYSDDTTSVWTELTYDDHGRVTLRAFPDSSRDSIAFLDEYATVSYTMRGDSVKVVRDFFGNVTSITMFDTAGAARSNTAVYNAMGRLVEQTDMDGHVHRYDYDDRGRLVRRTDPDIGYIRYWHDKTDALRFIRRTSDSTYFYLLYDADNRLIEEGTLVNLDTTKADDATYPDTSTAKIVRASYRFDSYPDSASAADTVGGLGYCKGRMIQVIDSAATTLFYYDARGRLRLKAEKLVGWTDYAKLEYEYYANNSLKRITYPDGRYTDYSIDRAGRLNGVSEVFAPDSIDYTAWGGVERLAYTTGITSHFEYDELSRLTKHRNLNAFNNLWGRSYEYDDGFLVKEYDLDTLGDTSSFGLVRHYAYDALGRLDSAWYKDANNGSDTSSILYDYDLNNNLLMRNILAGDSSTYWHYDGTNRDSVIKVGSTTYTFLYDDQGRITKFVKTAGLDEDTTLFAYDYRSLPIAIWKKEGGRTSLCFKDSVHNYYNYAGEKVKQVRVYKFKDDVPPYSCITDTSVRYYQYSNGSVVCEWNRELPVDSVTHINIYGLGKRLARKSIDSFMSDSLNIFLTDYRGNVKSEIKHNGGSGTQQYEYLPYGDVLSVAGSSPGPYRFMHKEIDKTNLIDFGPRYYEPKFGRFLAPDPLLATSTAYDYGLGNPVMNTDPTGMLPHPAVLLQAWKWMPFDARGQDDDYLFNEWWSTATTYSDGPLDYENPGQVMLSTTGGHQTSLTYQYGPNIDVTIWYSPKSTSVDWIPREFSWRQRGSLDRSFGLNVGGSGGSWSFSAASLGSVTIKDLLANAKFRAIGSAGFSLLVEWAASELDPGPMRGTLFLIASGFSTFSAYESLQVSVGSYAAMATTSPTIFGAIGFGFTGTLGLVGFTVNTYNASDYLVRGLSDFGIVEP